MKNPKPCKCGCGGEAEVYTQPLLGCYIMCGNCGIRTRLFINRTKAITAWNTAMGKDKIDELMEHIWRDKLDTREKIVNLVERMLR